MRKVLLLYFALVLCSCGTSTSHNGKQKISLKNRSVSNAAVIAAANRRRRAAVQILFLNIPAGEKEND